ncbi:MAG: hypothetical protein HC865_24070 [Cyanobacteria bacterium RU_5_0]|nr:hypothetical protein [Cyanobacteria bacterium RU_5_0]
MESQLMLRINQSVKGQLDEIIQGMQKMVANFSVKTVDERSPLRNVLNTAIDPMSTLEVIKNYIRYQTGRKNHSKIWDKKYSQQYFADAVIQEIENLATYIDKVFTNTQQELEQEINALEPDSGRRTQLEELKTYFQKHQLRLRQELHLNLTQLYLGYLSREHTATRGK